MNARRYLAGLGVAAAATTVVTGCSPSTVTSSATSQDFDPCSVVTQDDAGRALGGTVSRGVVGNATVEGGKACVFFGSAAPNPDDPNTAQSDSVRVAVVKGADAKKWFADYKSKVSAEPVAGLGDQAYYDGHASLSILDGDAYVRVAVIPAVGAPSLPDEQTLAAAILPKL